MGKIIVIVLSVMILFAGCTDKKKPQPTAKPQAISAVVSVTENDFVAKIGDYNATPETFKYKGNTPCVIDFYATWCGPCKVLSPIMDKLSLKYKGKVAFYRVDVDKNTGVASAFGIQAIPTLLWIPMSGKPFMTQGLMSQEELEKTISEQLLK